jgi:hypothetical protein
MKAVAALAMLAAAAAAAAMAVGISAPAPAAAAESLCPSSSWCARAESLLHSLMRRPETPDRDDIIAPPPGIDPQMALAPTGGARAALRVIRPRDPSEQQ